MSSKCCHSHEKKQLNICTISAPPNGTPLATVCDQIIPTGLVVRSDINKNLVAALASDIPDLGAGSRLTFDKNRGAFRAGEVVDNEWDNANVGNNSAAFGFSNTALGFASFAEGISTVATDDAAHAEGINTESSGAGSHAEGIFTFATDDASHSEGIFTFSIDPATHTEGIFTFALEPATHTEGIFTAADAPISHAEGLFTQTNDVGTHIMGSFGSSRLDPFSWQLAGGTTPTGTPGEGISAIIRTTLFGTPQPSGEMITNVFTTGNADYAEYFEWNDGNPNNEDRVGYFVELVNGNKIQYATSQDKVIGITSRTACVNADAAELGDPNLIERDPFGRPITQSSFTVGANAVLAQYGTTLTETFTDKNEMINAATNKAIEDLLSKLSSAKPQVAKPQVAKPQAIVKPQAAVKSQIVKNKNLIQQKPLNLGGVLSSLPVGSILSSLPVANLIAQLGLLPANSIQDLSSKLKAAHVDPLTLVVSQLKQILAAAKINPANLPLTDLLSLLNAKQVKASNVKAVNLNNYLGNLPVSDLVNRLGAIIPTEVPLINQLPIVYPSTPVSVHDLAQQSGIPLAQLLFLLNLPLALVLGLTGEQIANLALNTYIGDITVAELANKINMPIANLVDTLIDTHLPIPDLAGTLGLTVEQLGNLPVADLLNLGNVPVVNLSRGLNLPVVDIIPKLNLTNISIDNLASRLQVTLTNMLTGLANLPVSNLANLANLPASTLLESLLAPTLGAKGLLGNSPVSGLLGNLPVSNLLGGSPTAGLLGNLPVSGLLAALPVSGIPVSELPVAGLLGNSPVAGLVGNLAASGLIKDLSVADVLGNLPTGDLPVNNVAGNLPTLPINNLVSKLNLPLNKSKSINQNDLKLPTQSIEAILVQYGIKKQDIVPHSNDSIVQTFTNTLKGKLEGVQAVNVVVPAHRHRPRGSEPYVPRSQDPKWIPVGLLGKIYVRDDGNCVVGGLCQSNSAGIAIPADNTSITGVKYRILERSSSDPFVIRVLFQHVFVQLQNLD
uniref:Peptidase G2 IMC autoproteolytic cleavage domain-containing protein n=1 Tax=viral metagenome TaxID=1070528 RepID=A0A6C0CB17_9ZZZZ